MFTVFTIQMFLLGVIKKKNWSPQSKGGVPNQDKLGVPSPKMEYPKTEKRESLINPLESPQKKNREPPPRKNTFASAGYVLAGSKYGGVLEIEGHNDPMIFFTKTYQKNTMAPNIRISSVTLESDLTINYQCLLKKYLTLCVYSERRLGRLVLRIFQCSLTLLGLYRLFTTE